MLDGSFLTSFEMRKSDMPLYRDFSFFSFFSFSHITQAVGREWEGIEHRRARMQSEGDRGRGEGDECVWTVLSH